MKQMWQTAEAREQLLNELVKHQSISLSEGEKTFPYMVKEKLESLPYFQQHEHVQLVETGDGRHALLAYYKAPASKKTISLISHYDTVGIEDYGEFQELAFDMKELTEHFRNNTAFLDEVAIKDLNSGDFDFGRGSMDMKPGLMLHMSLIEKAIDEQWNVNLVLMTVPDEEVNSTGMRAAVKALDKLCQQDGLEMTLHLNSEPTFQQASDDDAHYVYTGSIGKIMPSVLCYGKETHVGTPMTGISSNLMLSYINQELEYNAAFKENFENEMTPLPVSLFNKDLKSNYDVQTPFRSAALYNVFMFKESADSIFEKFDNIVRQAVQQCESKFNQILESEQIDQAISIQVLSYDELRKYAVKQYGEQKVNEVIASAEGLSSELYMQAIHITDQLMGMCKSLAPAVVEFFTPPYYPAVNASYNDLIESLVVTANETSKERFNRESKRIHFFNGISDLSYAASQDNESGELYRLNTPPRYEIPFESIKRISAPVFNCGPIGKDAHQVSERIHKKNAYEELPVILETLIKKHFL